MGGVVAPIWLAITMIRPSWKGSTANARPIWTATGTNTSSTESDSTNMVSPSITNVRISSTTVLLCEKRDQPERRLVELEVGEQPAERAGDRDDARDHGGRDRRIDQDRAMSASVMLR